MPPAALAECRPAFAFTTFTTSQIHITLLVVTFRLLEPSISLE